MLLLILEDDDDGQRHILHPPFSFMCNAISLSSQTAITHLNIIDHNSSRSDMEMHLYQRRLDMFDYACNINMDD